MFDRPAKMLVADDSQLTLKIFRDVAQRSCSLLELIETTNGRDCVKLLGRGDVDLAFIDIHMPEMSGLDALRGARHVGIKTFVTLMSGPSSMRFRPLARELKAYEFLVKPFGVRDVEAVIRTYRRAMQATSVLVVDGSATMRKLVRKVLDGRWARHARPAAPPQRRHEDRRGRRQPQAGAGGDAARRRRGSLQAVLVGRRRRGAAPPVRAVAAGPRRL